MLQKRRHGGGVGGGGGMEGLPLPASSSESSSSSSSSIPNPTNPSTTGPRHTQPTTANNNNNGDEKQHYSKTPKTHGKKTILLFGLVITIVVVELILLLLKNNHNTKQPRPPPQTTWSKKKKKYKNKMVWNVTELNEQYVQVQDIVHWICRQQQQQKNTNIIYLTSFGPSSMVILDYMMKEEQECHRNIPIVTIDTLYLFPETYQFIAKLQKNELKHFKVHIYQPLLQIKTRQAFENKYGTNLFERDPQRYAQVTKIEPTQRALQDFQAHAWITGRRQSQGGQRLALQAFEMDAVGFLKINPLWNWSHDQVWDYIHTHHLSYHPLHDQGYKSIGDFHSTFPVPANASERSGRIFGGGGRNSSSSSNGTTTNNNNNNQTECGMHTGKLQFWGDDENDENGNDNDAKQPPPQTTTTTTTTTKNNNNNNFVEVTSKTFRETVMDMSNHPHTHVFLVFYHPSCGHCRQFMPTFFNLSQTCRQETWPIQMARFSVGQYRVPKYAKDIGLTAPGVPTMYWITQQQKKKPAITSTQTQTNNNNNTDDTTPPPKVHRYRGSRNYISLYKFLQDQLWKEEEKEEEDVSKNK